MYIYKIYPFSDYCVGEMRGWVARSDIQVRQNVCLFSMSICVADAWLSSNNDLVVLQPASPSSSHTLLFLYQLRNDFDEHS